MVGEGKKKMRSLSCFLGCAYNSLIFVSASKHPSASTSMALSYRYLPTSHPTPQPMHRPARQTHARKASRSGATHDHDHHDHHAQMQVSFHVRQHIIRIELVGWRGREGDPDPASFAE